VYSLSHGTVDDRLNVFDIRIPRLRERREDIRTACRGAFFVSGAEIWRKAPV
jgi:transcriptional regulator with AAA-type ATPase domain